MVNSLYLPKSYSKLTKVFDLYSNSYETFLIVGDFNEEVPIGTFSLNSLIHKPTLA